MNEQEKRPKDNPLHLIQQLKCNVEEWVPILGLTIALL